MFTHTLNNSYLYNFHLIIADNVQAIKDCWYVGDEFLLDMYPALQAWNKTAEVCKTSPPYVFQHYNINGFFNSALSRILATTRILNAFVEGFNKHWLLPRYVIVIPDADVINSILETFDFGLEVLMEENLSWLFRQMNKVIERRRQDLMYKKPGAVAGSFEPRVIWVKMMNRPFDEESEVHMELKQIRAKFNSCLEELVRKERYMYIMNLNVFEIGNIEDIFDSTGKLTREGKLSFWQELDSIFKRFDRQEIDLKPPRKLELPKKKKKKNNRKGGFKKENWMANRKIFYK